MKLKNLAAVVMAGMLIASVGHAAQSSSSDDMMLSDESGTYMQDPAKPVENIGSMHTSPAGGADTGANPDSSNMLSDNSSNNTSNANNDMSADTATGDDDY